MRGFSFLVFDSDREEMPGAARPNAFVPHTGRRTKLETQNGTTAGAVL
jgi:hypothetical protein